MKSIRKFLLFFIFSGSSISIWAQNQDLSVVLQESVINKIFKAIGEIKGTSNYSIMFMDGTYDWALLNPQIKLHPNKADFISDVKVTAGKYGYLIHVSGNVEVCYEPTSNLIYVEITEAKFPLNIMFFGKLKHLWDVDLVRYFETPLTFPGPLSIGAEMVFDMPDKTQKKIVAHPLNCGVKIAEKHLFVTAELEFVNRPYQTIK